MTPILTPTGENYRAGLNIDLREVIAHSQSAVEDSRDMRADKNFKQSREDRAEITKQISLGIKNLKKVAKKLNIKVEN